MYIKKVLLSMLLAIFAASGIVLRASSCIELGEERKIEKNREGEYSCFFEDLFDCLKSEEEAKGKKKKKKKKKTNKDTFDLVFLCIPTAGNNVYSFEVPNAKNVDYFDLIDSKKPRCIKYIGLLKTTEYYKERRESEVLESSFDSAILSFDKDEHKLNVFFCSKNYMNNIQGLYKRRCRIDLQTIDIEDALQEFPKMPGSSAEIVLDKTEANEKSKKVDFSNMLIQPSIYMFSIYPKEDLENITIENYQSITASERKKINDYYFPIIKARGNPKGVSRNSIHLLDFYEFDSEPYPLFEIPSVKISMIPDILKSSVWAALIYCSYKEEQNIFAVDSLIFKKECFVKEADSLQNYLKKLIQINCDRMKNESKTNPTPFVYSSNSNNMVKVDVIESHERDFKLELIELMKEPFINPGTWTVIELES